MQAGAQGTGKWDLKTDTRRSDSRSVVFGPL